MDVFRRADACPDVAQAGGGGGAKAVWLQLGLVSPEARRITEDGRPRVRRGRVHGDRPPGDALQGTPAGPVGRKVLGGTVRFPRRRIGVPGFEPGTSPTRTARATRLRHTPRRHRVADGMAAGTRSSPSATSSSTSRRTPTTGRSGSRWWAPRGVAKIACGVSASRELFERAAGGGRADGARPSRALLAERHAAWSGPSCGSACGRSSTRPHARRLPPGARRAPGDRQQRLSLPGARRRAGASLRRRRLGRAARRAAAGATSPTASRRSSAACRSSSRTGPKRSGGWLICSGGAARHSRDAVDGRLRLLRHGRSGRADEARSQGGGHPLRRGRPLRDRDVGRAAAGRADRGRVRASSGSSSICRTPYDPLIAPSADRDYAVTDGFGGPRPLSQAPTQRGFETARLHIVRRAFLRPRPQLKGASRGEPPDAGRAVEGAQHRSQTR